MTQEPTSALLRAIRPRLTRFIPYAPSARQQAALLLSLKLEVLYGGAAGGGKSDWILMAALQFADVPGYNALILRRTFPMLSQADGLLPRAAEWLSGTGAIGRDSANGVPTRWSFPAGGSLVFGHLQYERDKYAYQGGAYQFIGFDELTQFTESQYLYLFSRLRRLEVSQVPLRMRASSNPGGIGHDWVKARFLTERRSERVFLPARIDDNPALDRDEYVKSLMHLHPYERAQLLSGDWDARPPGSHFRREWFELVEAAPTRAKRIRAWDFAATEAKPGTDPDWTAGCRMSRSGDTYYIEDMARFRATAGAVEARVRQTAELDGQEVGIWLEQEPGSSGKMAAAAFVRLLSGFAARSQTATGSKIVRANPLAAQAEAGNVKLVNGPWVGPFLTELEHFPGEGHDDQVDAASLAFDKLTSRRVSWDDLYPIATEERPN